MDTDPQELAEAAEASEDCDTTSVRRPRVVPIQRLNEVTIP
jgi:hypothetical protein